MSESRWDDLKDVWETVAWIGSGVLIGSLLSHGIIWALSLSACV